MARRNRKLLQCLLMTLSVSCAILHVFLILYLEDGMSGGPFVHPPRRLERAATSDVRLAMSTRQLPKLDNCTTAFPSNGDRDRWLASSSSLIKKEPCALLFFGLAKSFRSLVLPSIQKQILNAQSARCDVFAHTYNVTELHSDRNNEHGETIDPLEIYDLTPHVQLESIADFERQHNMTHLMQDRFRVHRKHGWTPSSFVNMLRQWHSIEQVWKLMQRHEAAFGVQYDRVGFFRSDVYYQTPIDISKGGDAVIPAFGKMINDRMFYGSYENAFVWSNVRFRSVDCYHPPLPTHGLHSEHFMDGLILPNIPNWTERSDICFHRVRRQGSIKDTDCAYNYIGPRPWAKARKKKKRQTTS